MNEYVHEDAVGVMGMVTEDVDLLLEEGDDPQSTIDQLHNITRDIVRECPPAPYDRNILNQPHPSVELSGPIRSLFPTAGCKLPFGRLVEGGLPIVTLTLTLMGGSSKADCN